MNSAPKLYDEALSRLREGDLAGGAAGLETTLALAPDHVEARYRLGKTYLDLLRLKDAERELRAVMRLRPEDPRTYSALGIVLVESGRGAEGLEVHEAAVSLRPTDPVVTTNWLNAQQYVEGVAESRLLDSHKRWAALHAPGAAPTMPAERRVEGPLTVGFVSPDLTRHPVGRLSVKMFENLDPALIRPLVFSTRPAELEDDISRRIARAVRWTTAFGLSDATLGAFIKQAKVDVLIDMCGHMAHNRLTLFAARAAPVQVSWLGYTGTTGVPAMDYVLANDVLVPRSSEAFFTEKIHRLPHWHACFEGPAHAPAVGPLPAARAGFVTFGCFNNPAKLSGAAIERMAAILRCVANSRLVLRYRTLASQEVRERLTEAFAAQGIALERIDAAGDITDADFMAAYNKVDMVLDTFPYSGATTTCEAAWMGCPVITIRGATFAGRQSAAFLTAAGYPEFIAAHEQGYEDLAVRLAGDLERLAVMRAEMRARIAASPVCDGAGFAQTFTAAMRAIWVAATR